VPALRVLVSVLALEGVLLAGLGVADAVATLLDDEADRAPALTAAAFAVVLGAAVLLLLARGVERPRGWARTPAVVLNVLPLPVARGAFQAGAWWVGAPIVLLAGSVLYLFATPDLRDAFRETA
jgi:hypothetical protein